MKTTVSNRPSTKHKAVGSLVSRCATSGKQPYPATKYGSLADSLSPHYSHWVLNHARETILQTYRQLEAQRRSQYEAHLSALPFYQLWQIYRDGAPLPPHQLEGLKMQMHSAWEHMHRALDKDWQNCLQKYPAMLDYFFGLVELGMPEEQDARVEQPMIHAGEKKKRKEKRGNAGPGVFGGGAPQMGAGMPQYPAFVPGAMPPHMPGPFAAPAYPPY